MKDLLGMEKRGMVIILKGDKKKRDAVATTFVASGMINYEEVLESEEKEVLVFKGMVGKDVTFDLIEQNGAEIARENDVEINFVYFNAYDIEASDGSNAVKLSFGKIVEEVKVVVVSQRFEIPEQEKLLRECYQLIFSLIRLNA